jgi:hypothetical protein
MQSYWSNPPKPFLPGWKYEPVPGWGSNPAVAGPARVGVGNAVQIDPSLMRRAALMARVPNGEEAIEEPSYEPEKPFPWLYLVAGTLVLGAGAAFAYNMGWLKV